jgi:ribA/ribD-fused uncharacterized protein
MLQDYNMHWLLQRLEKGVPLKFIYFWGHTNHHQDAVGKFCFSQWYDSPFTVNHITYKTAEHWMMAHKALIFGDYDIYQRILNSNKPGEVKELGRQVKGYDDEVWKRRRFQIVTLGNIHKFNQTQILSDYLLQTDPRILVEASPVDTIWGIGMSQDDKDIDNVAAWRGENLLGFALMEARYFLKSIGRFHEIEDAVLPPWLRFPQIATHDIFWKNGEGETYLSELGKYLGHLTEGEKLIYEICFPQPVDWDDFYDFV